MSAPSSLYASLLDEALGHLARPAHIVPAARLARGKGSRRSLTLSPARGSRRDLVRGAVENPYDSDAPARPTTWGECQARGLGIETPCPYVSCAEHLYLDVSARGSLVLTHPTIEPDEMVETCALAVTAKHPDGLTLEATGDLVAMTRERVRQIESVAVHTMRVRLAKCGVR